MADVIHLEVGQNPPQDPSALLVARDLTGGFYVLNAEPDFQRLTAPATYPISDDDRSAAIDRATAYADQNGVAKIYVVT